MKNIISYVCLFVLLGLINSKIIAQQNEQVLCKIIDGSTSKPVVYATVLLKTKKVGTISDEDGNFRIPYVYKVKSDTLRISSIGYKTAEFPLINLSDDEVNVLVLNQKVESLNEITLITEKKRRRKLSARNIVKKAIKNIPINYPKEPFSYIAYYRDYQQILDSTYQKLKRNNYRTNYINLNEGIIEVFDSGFTTNKLTDTSNQTILYKFKTNRTFAVDSSLSVPYDNRSRKYLEGVNISPLGGNELNLLNLTNAIRNYNTMSFSFVHVLNKNFLPNHSFKLVQLNYLDDLPIYEIKFVLGVIEKSKYYSAEGSIFIAKTNFAIHKLTYNLYDKKKENHLYGVTIEYIPKGDLMYLNYITFNNSFEVKYDDYLKINDISYNFPMSYFTLYMNNDVDINSIKHWNQNFKIFYKNERLNINNVELVDKKEIKIGISNFYVNDRSNFSDNIEMSLKNIKDVSGGLINDIPTVKVNQFREIFVQEVFPKKVFSENYYLVNKNKPLFDSKVNTFIGDSHYWINTPLKSSKMD